MMWRRICAGGRRRPIFEVFSKKLSNPWLNLLFWLRPKAALWYGFYRR